MYTRFLLKSATTFLSITMMSSAVFAMEPEKIDTPSAKVRRHFYNPVSCFLSCMFPKDMQDDFVRQELNMIKGHQLSLWGIGIFSGDEFFSDRIKDLTGSHWSHVGVIFSDENNTLYNLEATASFGQIMYEHLKPQVQIKPWEQVLIDYDGDVAMRQFKFPQDFKIDPIKITQYLHDNIGKSYERNYKSLVKALNRTNDKEDLTTLFCSELAANCLMTFGCIQNNGWVSSDYVPRDFVDDTILRLVDNIELEKLKVVKQLEKNKAVTNNQNEI